MGVRVPPPPLLQEDIPFSDRNRKSRPDRPLCLPGLRHPIEASRFLSSASPLPTLGITPGVEEGKYHDLLLGRSEQDGIGKPSDHCPTDRAVNYGELERVPVDRR